MHSTATIPDLSNDAHDANGEISKETTFTGIVISLHSTVELYRVAQHIPLLSPQTSMHAPNK